MLTPRFFLCYIGSVPYWDKDEHRRASRESQRRRRKAARAAGGAAVPPSARKALAGKLKRAAALLKAKPTKKKLPAKKKKTAKKPPSKKKPIAKSKRSKVVGRITPKGKAKTPPPGSSRPVDPGGMVRMALGHAEAIVLGDGSFTLHDANQVINIVRNALETIAVVDSHRPPAQVEAEMTQFVEVALDFVPSKRREDFRAAFEKALKAAT